MSLSPNIRKAAVLGAGLMGSGIAAHLANCGIPILLLDVPPKALDDKEKAAGLTLEAKQVRNRLATVAIDRMAKDRRTPFYDPADAALIEPGNLEDDLARAMEADWVIEAVVEDLKIKQALYRRIEELHRPGCIVTSNTSGLPIRKLIKGRGDQFTSHFLNTHFFNPVRWMYLLEVIPGKGTDKAVTEKIVNFSRDRLGKGVVLCKDTPNFITTRLLFLEAMSIPRLALEHDLTVEEVDALMGEPIGRPRTAFFRLMDFVGVDILHLVSLHAYKALTKDECRDRFVTPPCFAEMTKRGLVGDKGGGGFYKRARGPAGEQNLVMDLKTMEYREARKPDLPILNEARGIADAGKRIKFLVSQGDKAGRFLWAMLSDLLAYCANRIPEISDDIASVDRAMRWGFSWELGPFEMWDALGVKEVVARLEKEGRPVPPLARKVLDSPSQSFYGLADGHTTAFQVRTGKQRVVECPKNVLALSEFRKAGRVVKDSANASLLDIGRGVACLELHGPDGVIPYESAEFIQSAVHESERNFRGLVVTGTETQFCAGPDLKTSRQWASSGDWSGAEAALKSMQDALLAIKYSTVPVVAAIRGETQGPGCDLAMQCARIQAAPELRMGSQEIVAGILPAAGQLKEWAVRADETTPGDDDNLMFPFILQVVNILTMARIAYSAPEAMRLGWLRRGDEMSINRDTLIFHARQKAELLSNAGWRPPRRRTDIRVLGEAGIAELKSVAWNLKEAHFISDHHRTIVSHLANAICGGPLVRGSVVNEQYLLDLEREAFLALLKEAKTQERIESLVTTGRPKRN